MEPYARLRFTTHGVALPCTPNARTPTAPSRTLTQRFAPAYNQPCNDPT